MVRKFFVGGNWKCNGTSEEVKKIVSTLNDGQVPSSDVVGMDVELMILTIAGYFVLVHF